MSVAWFKLNGDFLSRLVPELSLTADIRLRQFRMISDESQSLGLAKVFIAAKIRSAVAVLSHIRSNRPGVPELGAAVQDLRAMINRVQGARAQDHLLGFEGIASRRYFAGLRKGFDGDLVFAGRARRPPPDPVNSLLSFGYVIMVNAVASLLEARGFDPYVGFLHAVRSGRPSLALDITEELRHAVVDRFVLRVCNRRELMPKHFRDDSARGGVRLTRVGMRKIFRAWEAFNDSPLAGIKEGMSPEALMHQQTDRLVAHARGRAVYEPVFAA